VGRGLRDPKATKANADFGPSAYAPNSRARALLQDVKMILEFLVRLDSQLVGRKPIDVLRDGEIDLVL
jgi:hypothetical protein